MNRISDRRKLHGLLNQEDEGGLIRMSTTATYLNNTPPSIDELRRIIGELEKALKLEREQRLEAEENLKLYQIRSMMREKEFHKILEETDKKIRSYVKENEASSVVKEIKKSYEQILKNFESTNQATNAIIENKYRENMVAMERRIDNIFVVMNEQLGKTKMMSNESVNEIRRQIEQAIHLVKHIETENVELKLAIKKQIHKSRLLQEQRKLLLDEVVNKKFIIAKLAEDNRNLKKRYEQPMVKVTKPHHSAGKLSDNQLDDLSGQLKKFKTLSNTFNQFETRETFAQRTRQASFFENPVAVEERTGHERNRNLSKSKFSVSSQKSYKNEKPKGTVGKAHLFSNVLDGHKASIPAQINYKKMERKYTKKPMASKSRILNDDENSEYMVTMAKNQTVNTESVFESPEKAQNERTVEHLRKCLEREKKRANELSRLVTKIQNRNEEVNEAIFNMVSAARARYNEEGGSLENLLKCEQLLKLISDMKKRLSMCENPSLHCGWGQIEMDSLLKQAES